MSKQNYNYNYNYTLTLSLAKAKPADLTAYHEDINEAIKFFNQGTSAKKLTLDNITKFKITLTLGSDIQLLERNVMRYIRRFTIYLVNNSMASFVYNKGLFRLMSFQEVVKSSLHEPSFIGKASSFSNYSSEELLTLDFKTMDLHVPYSVFPMPVYSIIARYAKGIGDYEATELAEHIFEKLNTPYSAPSDTIISFYHIMLKTISIYSSLPSSTSDYACRLEDAILHYHNKNNRGKNHFYSCKKTIGAKLLEPDQFLNDILKDISKDPVIFKKLNQLAELCDSPLNFFSCPVSFNKFKGCIVGVHDQLPYMITAISNNSNLSYTDKNNNQVIANSATLKNWHDFFVDNQAEYFLTPFYFCENNVLKGKLNHIPTNVAELDDYLDSILKLFEERKNLILK